MTAPLAVSESAGYLSRFFTLAWASCAQIVRPPSHSRRAEAARRSARHVLLLTAIIGVAIITLMYALDVREISLMPKRGTPGLWPIRILTDFGKDVYVLGSIAGLLVIVAMAAPAAKGMRRSLLLGFGIRLQFLFFAVLVSILAGELIKYVVGRGRPFVGGQANAFNFSHFAGTEAYASFPSGHATTAVALAFAVSALWPAGADWDDGLCPRDHGNPPGVAGPSSQRCGCRRPGRHHRRDGRALLVCRPPSRLYDRSRRHNCAAFQPLAEPPQRGCPGARSPHKRRSPRRPCPAGSTPLAR
jgi:hypothetical protein